MPLKDIDCSIQTRHPELIAKYPYALLWSANIRALLGNTRHRVSKVRSMYPVGNATTRVLDVSSSRKETTFCQISAVIFFTLGRISTF